MGVGTGDTVRPVQIHLPYHTKIGAYCPHTQAILMVHSDQLPGHHPCLSTTHQVKQEASEDPRQHIGEQQPVEQLTGGLGEEDDGQGHHQAGEVSRYG